MIPHSYVSLPEGKCSNVPFLNFPLSLPLRFLPEFLPETTFRCQVVGIAGAGRAESSGRGTRRFSSVGWWFNHHWESINVYNIWIWHDFKIF